MLRTVLREGTGLTTAPFGNVLGETTAESDDQMLKDAFYESRSYQELSLGHDFRFVVGRRGSGKSALFRKVSEAAEREPGVLLGRPGRSGSNHHPASVAVCSAPTWQRVTHRPNSQPRRMASSSRNMRKKQ